MMWITSEETADSDRPSARTTDYVDFSYTDYFYPIIGDIVEKCRITIIDFQIMRLVGHEIKT